MALSFVMEYLLSQERPGGGRLVMPGASQTIVPLFPPNTYISLIFPPPEPIYAQIWTWIRIGASVNPGAFEGYFQQAGGNMINAIFNDSNGIFLDFYMPVTQASPVLARIENVTNLTQYWESYGAYVEVQTREDYGLVLEHLRRIGTSAKLQADQAEATRLLGKLELVKPTVC